MMSASCFNAVLLLNERSTAMSSDVAIYDDELKSLEEQVQACIRAMDSLTGEARLAKFSKAQDLLKMAQKNFHHFKVEIRALDGQEFQVYDRKCQAHNQMLSSLKEQLTQKRNEPPAAGGVGGEDRGHRGDGKDEARQTADRIKNTQQAALASLARTEKTLEETKDIGDDAANTLAKQTEQMKRMNEKLDNLDTEVKRGKQELNLFIRRMMTDKIILCFACLIIVAIVVVVVLKLRSPESIPLTPAERATPMPLPVQTPEPPTPAPDSHGTLAPPPSLVRGVRFKFW